ncbi:MAG: ABC transporter ATP-binding protein [Rubrobacter sp.]|nr:ABC transporter ATP-binding protein [Rubrobacter sp.]
MLTSYLLAVGYPIRVTKRFAESRDGLRSTRATLAHFVPFLRPRRRGLLAALFLLLLETATSLALPWPLALAIDHVLRGEPLPGFLPGFFGDISILLASIAFLLIFLTAASRGLASLRRYLLNKLGQQTVFDMREALYKKVHALGLDYHGKKRTGDTITRVTSDVKEVRTLLVDSIVEVGSSFFVLFGMLIVMLLLSWQLTLLALLTVPFLFFAVRRYRKSLIERMRVVRTREGAIASVMQEAITGIRAVKMFGREDEEMGRFRRESRDSLDASVESSFIEAKFSIVLGIVGGVGTALVLYFGSRQVLAGTLTTGQLTVFVAYLALFLSPLWALTRQVNQIGKSLVSGERIVELLQAEPTVKESPDARPAPPLDGRVTFEDVHFSYEDEAGEVLRGVDFEAEPGSRVALVGVSGAGKTTVTSLLARLYDPGSGRVLVDGLDVRDLTLKSLREAVTFVPQEPMLFRSTVAENISYGRPGASPEEIERAAALAGADEFVREMPEGYDTLLSERGESLSGGQRQRISIARAMLRDTPILILDEPQSGLDAEAAEAVENNWQSLTQGRTTFIIAHELRLVRDVDRILVLDEGRVVESGTHEALLSSGGLYARLHSLQEKHPVEP